MVPCPDRSPLLKVAAAFGLEARELEVLPSVFPNAVWRVETSDGPYVLRRYGLALGDSGIEWQHAVLRHLSAKGWPVALPVEQRGGRRIVNVGGRSFSLFPFLEGRPAEVRSGATQRIKGRLLARLHDDLAGFPLEVQRPGFGRVWELDLFVQAAGTGSFNALLARFGDVQPDLAAAIRRQRYRSLRELARLGYGELRSTTIHGAFGHDALLFSGGELSGLLGCDLVRRDSAAVDIAVAIQLDCIAAPGEIEVAQSAGAFVEGYAGRRPLSRDERRVIPGLVRAEMLAQIAMALTQWASHEATDVVPRVSQIVGSELAILDRRTAELQRVLDPGTA